MLLLSSRSPQRSRLLAAAGIAFRVVDSSCDEEAVIVAGGEALALARARCKAMQADLGDTASGVVLGADTVVVLGDDCLGKPRDRDQAFAILSRLQGTTHRVVTGHCCMLFADGRPRREAQAAATTEVAMSAMTAEEIRSYVASGESDGRAGAYAIQETGDRFIAGIRGDFDTVVGLNIATVLRLYADLLGSPAPRS